MASIAYLQPLPGGQIHDPTLKRKHFRHLCYHLIKPIFQVFCVAWIQDTDDFKRRTKIEKYSLIRPSVGCVLMGSTAVAANDSNEHLAPIRSGHYLNSFLLTFWQSRISV